MRLGDGSSAFISVDYGRASFKGRHLEYGEIDSKGLLKFISDPYESPLSLVPEASEWNKNGRNGGTVLDADNFSFVIPAAGRGGFGIYAGFKHIDAAVLFMGKEHVMTDSGFYGFYGEAEGTVYSAAMMSFYGIRLLLASSVSSFSRIGLLCAVSADFNGNSASIRIGQLERVYQDSERELASCSLKLHKSIYSMDFLHIMGLPAVYSFEYQDTRLKCTQTLDLDKLSAAFSISASRDRKGLQKREYRIRFSHDLISFSFSESGRYSFRAVLPGAEISLSEGRYEVRLTKSFELPHSVLEIGLSSSDGLELALKADF